MGAIKNKLNNVPVNRYIDIAILVLLLIFPLFVKEFRVELMGRYVCYAIFALSLDLLWGYTGLLSLGHAVLFGLGGYIIGISYQLQSGIVPSFMQRVGFTEIPWFYVPLESPLLAALFGMIVPAIVACILGFFMFSSKIKGVFFTIITLVIAEVFSDFVTTSTGYTNGFNGLQSIKRFAMGDFDGFTKIQYYYIIIAVAVLVFLFCLWFEKSRLGKVAVSIRENEKRLGFFGYETAKYKIIIYTISGFIAGLAGVLYAPATSTITTQDIGVTASTFVVIWIAVGGRGNLTGAVLGTLIINWAESLLSETFSGIWQLIIGILLLVVIFFMPDGIVGRLINLQRKFKTDKKKNELLEKSTE